MIRLFWDCQITSILQNLLCVLYSNDLFREEITWTFFWEKSHLEWRSHSQMLASFKIMILHVYVIVIYIYIYIYIYTVSWIDCIHYFFTTKICCLCIHSVIVNPSLPRWWKPTHPHPLLAVVPSIAEILVDPHVSFQLTNYTCFVFHYLAWAGKKGKSKPQLDVAKGDYLFIFCVWCVVVVIIVCMLNVLICVNLHTISEKSTPDVHALIVTKNWFLKMCECKLMLWLQRYYFYFSVCFCGCRIIVYL